MWVLVILVFYAIMDGGHYLAYHQLFWQLE
jgi:hypothetical protein